MSKIARHPVTPPAVSPSDPRYFDERDLEKELQRTFQICHECRMCVGYCRSFPELFSRIDRDIESGNAEGAEALSATDFKVVMDECWQCKLCFVKCPYTKDDGANELLDYPRLMARTKAVESKRNGVSVVDTILGEPQLVGTLGGGIFAPMTNLIHSSRLVRRIQEKVAGISSEFPIPPMAKKPFSTWFDEHPADPNTAEKSLANTNEALPMSETHVVLFATCYGEFNAPNVPAAAVDVLRHNGLTVLLPGDLPNAPATSAPTCCGMPNLDGGDVDGLVAKAERNIALLYPQAKLGIPILVPSPTCSYTMKKEWPEYVPSEEARVVAAQTMDVMEYLVTLGGKKTLDLEFKKGLGTVAYHAACHLRAQKIGFPGQRVLAKTPDADIRMVEECSAVDGTWGMKAEHYATGRKYAQKMVRAVTEAEPDLVVTDCTLSALRIAHEAKEKGAPVRVVHPIEALREAYGLGDAEGTEGIVPT